MGELVVWVLAGAVIWLSVSLRRQGKLLGALRDRLDRLDETKPPQPQPEMAPEIAAKPTPEALRDPVSATNPKAWPTSPKPQKESQKKREAFVFTQSNASAVSEWLKEKWFYAIAALSLVLSGVFLIQYGVENGVLTPFWRVIGTLALGVALIGGGEWIRRRASDETGHAAALPSTLSGAGVVVLFIGILSARQMYGLIGVEMALVGLVAVSVVALVLGWFYGPFLSIVGLLGASIAPFLIGGSSNQANFLFIYFAIVSLVGLSIDTVARRAWVSVLAIVFPALAAWFAYFAAADSGVYFLGFLIAVALFSVTIPIRQLWPNQSGATVSSAVCRNLSNQSDKEDTDIAHVEFPTRLGFGAISLAMVAVSYIGWNATNTLEVWACFAAAMLLIIGAVYGLRCAPALMELAAGAVALFITLVATQGMTAGPLARAFWAGERRPPETAIEPSVYILIALGVAVSISLFMRGFKNAGHPFFWASGAAITAPATFVALDIFWQPIDLIGAYAWAGIAMVIAALMVFMAERVARVDADDKRRAALFAMAALGMMSFALVALLSDVALTVSLAVMVLLAALIDCKFDMWLLSLFAQLGTIVVGVRFAVVPGLDWLERAPFTELLLVGPIILVLVVGAWFALKERKRTGAILVVESGFWSMTAIFVSALFIRAIEDSPAAEGFSAQFVAVVMWLSMANQLYRAQGGARIMRIVRIALAVVFGLIGAALAALELLIFNPVWGAFSLEVAGPVLLNSLLIAYGVPALIFAIVAVKMPHLKQWVRRFFLAMAIVYTVLLIGLEIRHLWFGNDMGLHNGVYDGELYSYTIAMLLSSAGLLFLAFSKRNKMMRRLAMIGIGLTIAKVFLLDMAGLAGLIRVASFLGLGLSLAGLAWINGNMSRQWGEDVSEGDPADV